MAKKSMIAREAKRARTVAKFAAKRAQLKEAIANVKRVTKSGGKRRSRCKNCRAMRARFVSSAAVS